jgi:hypothetical protein
MYIAVKYRPVKYKGWNMAIGPLKADKPDFIEESVKED